VQCQQDGNDAKRGYPSVMRSGAGVPSAGSGAGVLLRQNAVQRRHSEPADGWPVVQADQASPSMVPAEGVKQKAISDIFHDAIQADIHVPSREGLHCADRRWRLDADADVHGPWQFPFFGSLCCFSFSASLW
jgi:hypothetical protein